MSEPKYKLVPVEPTAEMLEGLASEHLTKCELHWYRIRYQEMLAAAPSPPQDPRDEALRVAREALELMYSAWEELLPNLKNGVVQKYELVLTKAPISCTDAIRKIKELTGEK